MESKSRSGKYFEIVSIPSFVVMENVILGEGFKNYYYNNPAVVAWGSLKVKSCTDHDGAQGCELSRPTTICSGKNTPILHG